MAEGHERLSLTKLRQQAGLTQQELAALLGVTQKTISIWEKGTVEPKLSFRQVRQMMEALNCTLDELILAVEQ